MDVNKNTISESWLAMVEPAFQREAYAFETQASGGGIKDIGLAGSDCARQNARHQRH